MKSYACEFSPASLERVRFDIGIDQGAFTVLAWMRIAVLHAEHAGESSSMNMAEEIPIVHLPGSRFLAPRVVADLEVSDLAPRAIDVRDDVAFFSLHVIHVVQDLA